ncbi:hypothetical protein [Lutibacter sp.]|uniref:hypothetical protein n=1 Tax=Lutibacter sp. TaxID=1925666 RepID=UPI003568384B
MEDKLNELILKVDQLFETQKLILEKLDQSTILTKEPIIRKKQSEKEPENIQHEEIKLIIMNGRRLKQEFNLAVTPQGNRILAYLRTNDPKIFDGLKRKK